MRLAQSGVYWPTVMGPGAAPAAPAGAAAAPVVAVPVAALNGLAALWPAP